MGLLLVCAVLAATPLDVPSLTKQVEALRLLANARDDAELQAKGKPLLATLQQAARADDAPIEVLVLLGRTQEYLNEPAAAALTLDRAVTRAPKSASAHFYLGIAHQELDELEKSEKHLLEATVLDPSRRSAWVELARTRLGLQKAALAVPALEKALTLDEKDAQAHSMLGTALMELGRGADAIGHLERAVALEPKDLNSAYNAGQYFQNVDQPKKALPYFEQVANADANDWHVRAKLVQMHQALGHVAERDARRAEVLALRANGKIEAKHEDFCREQWSWKGLRVMAFESFELKEPRAVRYSFRIVRDGKFLRVISLGSYEFTTNYMRETGQLKPTERAWHLDGYELDQSHFTYGLFTSEPTYDEVRKLVVDVLSEKLKPSSSTSMKQRKP